MELGGDVAFDPQEWLVYLLTNIVRDHLGKVIDGVHIDIY